MSQTQATNNYWTSNFPSGGLPNGTSARERQKEEARRQRARQSFHADGVMKNNHLFGEPRKVKPTEQDPLKDYIHAALGEFSGVAPSIMEQQHLLLGVSRAPQTPVDGKGTFFGSDKSKKIKQVDVNGVKDSSPRNKVLHSVDRVKECLEKASLPTKESTTNSKKHRHSTTPHKTPEPKDKISKSHSSSAKRHPQSPINGIIKPECNGVASEKNGYHAKSPSKRKEDGDRQTKNKPPRLSMPTKLSSNGLEGNEAVRVDSILKEMTQLAAPPLTGIHTPIKGSSQHGSFPFPDKPAPQAVPYDLSGKKKGSGLLSDDLHLSDDDSDDDQIPHGKVNAANHNKSNRHRSLSASSSSSGSSDDSDSDSSDSDSETETKETETKSWDLGSLASALNQRSTNGVVESPSSTTVGDDGLRGNQIAPGVHASPEKTSQVVQEPDKESNNFLFRSIEDVSDVFSSQMPANIFGDQSPLPLREEVGKTKLTSEIPPENSSIVHNSSEVSATNSHQEDSKMNQTSSNCNSNHNIRNDVNDGDLSLKVSKEKEKKEKSAKIDEVKPSGKTPKKSLKHKKETKGNTLENKKVEKTVELASTTEDSPKLNGESGKNLEKEKRVAKKKPVAKKTHSTAHDKEDDVKMDIDVVGNKDSVGEQLLANGISKVAMVLNGSSSPAVSPVKELEIPVTHLVNGDSGLNGENQHDSLIVTIDLGLLQRIPKIPGTNGTIVAKLTTTSPVVENGRVKARRQLSVDKNSEPMEIKKAKTGIESDSDDRRPRERTNSSSSASSRYSVDHDGSHRKRSPSQENDRYRKRRRHASENGIDRDRELGGKSHERERIRDRARDRDRDDRVRRGGSHSRDRHHDRLRDFDRPAEEPLINGYIPNSRSDCPCWCGGKKDDSLLTSYLEQLYGPNPRVPHNPDHYLQEAKKLKHKADGLSDKEKKPYGYVEAVLQFMKCGRALEQKQSENPESSSSACQMYRETRDLLSYAMRQFVPRASQQSDGSSDKRLMALCLRIQSVLHMKMYRLRKDLAQKNNRILLDYFKDKAQQPKGSQAPSPYNSNPSKMTGTPSPLSPTPSPSGSIGSIGSVGSTGSQEAVVTPSRNGKQPSSAMASPGNTCIPQRIYSLNTQHLNLTSHLVVSHEKWDLAHSLVLEHKDFFIDLDKKCGPLTPNSSVVSVSNYVQEALSRLKNS